METEYERDLFIDESGLDVECLNQPRLMMKYTKEFAKAEKEAARIKEQISVERARLDKDIRTNPSKYKLGDIKITEAVVTNAIITHKPFQDLTAQLIDANYEVTMMKGAMDSVKQRKDMLQELVKLHGQQYFAGPRVPRDLSHEVKQQITKDISNSSVKIARKRS